MAGVPGANGWPCLLLTEMPGRRASWGSWVAIPKGGGDGEGYLLLNRRGREEVIRDAGVCNFQRLLMVCGANQKVLDEVSRDARVEIPKGFLGCMLLRNQVFPVS